MRGSEEADQRPAECAGLVYHLFQFTQIRKEHDRIYVEEAFPEAESREGVEDFSSTDRVLTAAGSKVFDPEMQQRRLVERVSSPKILDLYNLCI